ncbi:unnamed protein product [Diplocarpon coronariae]
MIAGYPLAVLESAPQYKAAHPSSRLARMASVNSIIPDQHNDITSQNPRPAGDLIKENVRARLETRMTRKDGSHDGIDARRGTCRGKFLTAIISGSAYTVSAQDSGGP